MTTPWADDEQLFADLRAAVLEAGPVPDDVVAAGKAAFDLRSLDLELAMLIYDSKTDRELTGAVRSSALAVRSMVFGLDGISIDVDILADALVGQVSPAEPGRIVLEVRGGASVTADIDESGMFTVPAARPNEIRLRVQPANRRGFVTEWAAI